MNDLKIIKTQKKENVHITLFSIKMNSKTRYHSTYHKEPLTIDLIKDAYNQQGKYKHFMVGTLTKATKRFNEMIRTTIKFKPDNSKELLLKKLQEKKTKSQSIRKKFESIFHFPMPIDGMISVTMNKVSIDIVRFDMLIQQKHPEYDAELCTYKGKANYSLSNVVQEIYGKTAMAFVYELLE